MLYGAGAPQPPRAFFAEIAPSLFAHTLRLAEAIVTLAASRKRRFEIDTGQESVDSPAANAVRRKLTLYHAYQNRALADWTAAGKTWEEPRFRAIFLTASVARAYHVLALARTLQTHPTRRLVYAAPLSTFVTEPDPLTAPLFLDHFGHWQALADPHPTAAFVKAPVRIARAMESPFEA